MSTKATLVADSQIPPPFSSPSSSPLFIRRLSPHYSSEVEELKSLHDGLFPVKYNDEFYRSAVSGQAIKNVSSESKSDRNGTLFARVVTELPDPTSQMTGVIISQRLPFHAMKDSPTVSCPSTWPRAVYIMTLGTRSDWRRRGVAKRLLKMCEENAESEEGTGAIFLHVITYNTAAISFYEKNGYVRVREIVDYYVIGQKTYNCFLYVKYLNGAEPYDDSFFGSLRQWFLGFGRFLFSRGVANAKAVPTVGISDRINVDESVP